MKKNDMERSETVGDSFLELETFRQTNPDRTLRVEGRSGVKPTPLRLGEEVATGIF